MFVFFAQDCTNVNSDPIFEKKYEIVRISRFCNGSAAKIQPSQCGMILLRKCAEQTFSILADISNSILEIPVIYGRKKLSFFLVLYTFATGKDALC